MNLDPADHRSDASGPPFDVYEPYEPSVASSAPSSQSSIFSDSASAHSSIASSISDDFRPSQDDARERDRICAQAQLRAQAQYNAQPEEPSVVGKLIQENYVRPSLSYADVTSAAAQKRQHPRRCSLSGNQRPPPLVRQRDRKINFVDNLVDSAAQMVEVIWPLSVVPCNAEAGNSRGVLPLRTYIEETLRRSRTSYSTLQVALYYLILIKPFVPRTDFTRQQDVDCSITRALMCGRRMFLAALILASKYLQDRNYSAKAWSKMSGLRADEINANERAFLAKINWKLHIPKSVFDTWQEVVLRYTPQPPPSPGFAGFGFPSCGSVWKNIVPLLTAELDNLPMGPFSSKSMTAVPVSPQTSSPVTPTPSRPSLRPIGVESESQETTPTPATVLPRFLEPMPDIAPPTPALARMGPLPTPQMTPSSVASSTPAVSTFGSRRPSMCSAMSLAQKSAFNRCTMDICPPSISRRPSFMSLSSGSSPESLLSDHSRDSRSSSISSISTVSTNSSLALNRTSLARLATCRNVRLPLPDCVKEEETKENNGTSSAKPIIIEDDDVEMVCSPDMADFTVSEKVLHAPHRHSKHAPQYATPSVICCASGDKGRKRLRPRGGHNRRSELQEEVRFMLQESLDDDEDDGMDLASNDENSPEPATDDASRMLRWQPLMSENQPPASSSRSHVARAGTSRVPVLSSDGKKRACLSSIVSGVQPRRFYDGGGIRAL